MSFAARADLSYSMLIMCRVRRHRPVASSRGVTLDWPYGGANAGLRKRATEPMNLTVEIPDDIANRLTAAGEDLARRALEVFAVEELKSGRISEPELGRILGLQRLEIDPFLKAHGVYEDYTLEDFENERAALKSLGL